MTGETLCGFVVAAVLSIGFASSGRAALITWEFAGQLELVELGGNLPDGTAELAAVLTSLGVEVGVPVSGRVIFESSTADDRPEPQNARYGGAMIRSEITIDRYTLSSDFFNGDPDFVTREIFAGTFPELGISSFFTQHHLGDEIGLLSPWGLMGLELSSHDPLLFTAATQALPFDPPSLLDLDPFGYDENTAFGYGSEVFVGVSTDIGNFTLQASISRLERVPEPGIAALVAAGVIALAALRRRAW